VVVAYNKNASPTWSDVRAALLHFDRTGLQGLVKDLYAASKDNQAFLHARLGLGHVRLQPFKAIISNWKCPDVMKNQPISVSKAKKAIADYKRKRLGVRMGWQSCRYSIAKRHSASSNPAAWKMKATLLL
jgi:hypothetical protein